LIKSHPYTTRKLGICHQYLPPKKNDGNICHLFAIKIVYDGNWLTKIIKKIKLLRTGG
jgi:anaerobic ribonucleoside-triphosphate reductase